MALYVLQVIVNRYLKSQKVSMGLRSVRQACANRELDVPFVRDKGSGSFVRQ